MDIEYISLSKFHYNNIKKPSLPQVEKVFLFYLAVKSKLAIKFEYAVTLVLPKTGKTFYNQKTQLAHNMYT